MEYILYRLDSCSKGKTIYTTDCFVQDLKKVGSDFDNYLKILEAIIKVKSYTYIAAYVRCLRNLFQLNEIAIMLPKFDYDFIDKLIVHNPYVTTTDVDIYVKAMTNFYFDKIEVPCINMKIVLYMTDNYPLLFKHEKGKLIASNQYMFSNQISTYLIDDLTKIVINYL